MSAAERSYSLELSVFPNLYMTWRVCSSFCRVVSCCCFFPFHQLVFLISIFLRWLSSSARTIIFPLFLKILVSEWILGWLFCQFHVLNYNFVSGKLLSWRSAMFRDAEQFRFTLRRFSRVHWWIPCHPRYATGSPMILDKWGIYNCVNMDKILWTRYFVSLWYLLVSFLSL